LRLGDGFAVDLGDAREAPEVPAVIHELGAQHELIARPDDLPEPRFFDANEIKNRNPLFGARSFVCEQPAGLRQRLEDQHSGHDGMAWEVSLKIRLVHRDVLDGDDRLTRYHVEHAVDEQERKAMRETFEDSFDIDSFIVSHRRSSNSTP